MENLEKMYGSILKTKHCGDCKYNTHNPRSRHKKYLSLSKFPICWIKDREIVTIKKEECPILKNMVEVRKYGKI